VNPGGSQRERDEAHPAQDAELRRLPPSEQRDDSVEVIGMELTAYVCAAQAEFAGSADHVPERARGLDEQRRPMSRRRDARAVPELDREGAIRQGPLDAAPKPIGA
jgi:hypothetical protein